MTTGNIRKLIETVKLSESDLSKNDNQKLAVELLKRKPNVTMDNYYFVLPNIIEDEWKLWIKEIYPNAEFFLGISTVGKPKHTKAVIPSCTAPFNGTTLDCLSFIGVWKKTHKKNNIGTGYITKPSNMVIKEETEFNNILEIYSTLEDVLYSWVEYWTSDEGTSLYFKRMTRYTVKILEMLENNQFKEIDNYLDSHKYDDYKTFLLHELHSASFGSISTFYRLGLLVSLAKI